MARATSCFFARLYCMAAIVVVLTGCRLHRQIVREGAPLCCEGREPCASCAAVQQTNFSHGQRRPVVDAAGWVFGIPDRVLMLDWRVMNHDVGEQTQQDLARYLVYRNLDHTHVRINEYAPLDEWRRLRENDRISPFWRYTVGAAHTLTYSLIPGRLFGRDVYNPYTDTISIYSDVPALALKQAALAHNVRKRSLPGTYATFQTLPFVSLHQAILATEDISEYVDRYGAWEEAIDAREVLLADYGRDFGNCYGIFGPQARTAATLGATIGGHVEGRLDGAVIRSAIRQPPSNWSVSHIDDPDSPPEWGGSTSATIQETKFGGIFKVTVVTPDKQDADGLLGSGVAEPREKGDRRAFSFPVVSFGGDGGRAKLIPSRVPVPSD